MLSMTREGLQQIKPVSLSGWVFLNVAPKESPRLSYLAGDFESDLYVIVKSSLFTRRQVGKTRITADDLPFTGLGLL